MLNQIITIFLMFVIYSMLGWVLEVVAIGIGKKQWVNRGFLIGPYCPIYGFGCIAIVVLLDEFKDYPLAIFILAAVICSILEYLTSYTMEKLFKARWWDYSKKKFNLNGRICLENAVVFGILGTAMIYYINPTMQNIIFMLSTKTLYIISGVLAIVIFTDVGISFNVINKVKNLAFEVKKDNTYEITARVREILRTKGVLSKRLLNAYPEFISTIKSKKQELDEKREQFIRRVRENVNQKKLELKSEITRFKIK